MMEPLPFFSIWLGGAVLGLIVVRLKQGEPFYNNQIGAAFLMGPLALFVALIVPATEFMSPARLKRYRSSKKKFLLVGDTQLHAEETARQLGLDMKDWYCVGIGAALTGRMFEKMVDISSFRGSDIENEKAVHWLRQMRATRVRRP